MYMYCLLFSSNIYLLWCVFRYYGSPVSNGKGIKFLGVWAATPPTHPKIRSSSRKKNGAGATAWCREKLAKLEVYRRFA